MTKDEMTQMAILLSKLMPQEQIVEEIKEHSTNFLLTKDEHSKQRLTISCMLFLSSAVPMSAHDLINAIKEQGELMEQIAKSKSQ